MPGKITEELRRITREQGGASPQPAPPSAPAGSPAKRYGPLLTVVAVLLLAAVGWIVVRKIMDMNKLQDCVMSGRKNCVPVDTSP